jgi:hypothetical protein
MVIQDPVGSTASTLSTVTSAVVLCRRFASSKFFHLSLAAAVQVRRRRTRASQIAPTMGAARRNAIAAIIDGH